MENLETQPQIRHYRRTLIEELMDDLRGLNRIAPHNDLSQKDNGSTFTTSKANKMPKKKKQRNLVTIAPHSNNPVTLEIKKGNYPIKVPSNITIGSIEGVFEVREIVIQANNTRRILVMPISDC